MGDDVDFSAYLRLPRGSAREYLALGQLLLAARPRDAHAPVERAAARLERELTSFMTALRAWRDNSEELDALAKEELDFATDGLWKVFAERLEQWAVFEARAFAKMADANHRARACDYRRRVAKAERARHLQCHLLGGVGTGFTRLSYAKQAEFMTTLWMVIDEEGLEPEFGELVGSDFIAALRDCQRRYRELLADDDGQGGFQLNARRDLLERRIVLYLAAAVACVDEDDAEEVARLREALDPVEMLRELDRRSTGGIAHEGHDEVDIDPLLTQLDAVDAALGIELGDHVDHALSESAGAWQAS